MTQISFKYFINSQNLENFKQSPTAMSYQPNIHIFIYCIAYEYRVS
jgi:hypothetical protein